MQEEWRTNEHGTMALWSLPAAPCCNRETRPPLWAPPGGAVQYWLLHGGRTLPIFKLVPWRALRPGSRRWWVAWPGPDCCAQPLVGLTAYLSVAGKFAHLVAVLNQ
jgi:hypothetical protein